MFEYKPENWPAVLLGLAICAPLVGFGLLQQHHGGYWWLGAAVTAVGVVMGTAIILIREYGLHKTGGPMPAEVTGCPRCTAPLPARDRNAGPWRGCPRCGVQFVDAAALTFGLSQGRVWCKRILIGVC